MNTPTQSMPPLSTGAPVMEVSNGKKICTGIEPYSQTRQLNIDGELRSVEVFKPLCLPKLTCSICRNGANDPVTLCPATHILCRQCAINVTICPLCRHIPQTLDSSHQQLQKNELIQGFEIALEHIPWICPFGCQQLIDHHSLKEHAEHCLPYECNSCLCEKFADQASLDKHISTFCPEIEVTCEPCQRTMKRKALSEHKMQCPEKEVTVHGDILKLAGDQPSNTKIPLKRKYSQLLNDLSLSQCEAITALFKSTIQSKQTDSLITNIASLVQQQKTRVLAEIEFTPEQIDCRSPAYLLDIPITPIRIKRSDEYLHTMHLQLQKIDNSLYFRPQGKGLGLTFSKCVRLSYSFDDPSEPAANKLYTFTITGIARTTSENLMTIRLTPNQVCRIHTSDQEHMQRTMPLDLASFYQFFCNNFPGKRYLNDHPDAKFKITVSEEK